MTSQTDMANVTFRWAVIKIRVPPRTRNLRIVDKNIFKNLSLVPTPLAPPIYTSLSLNIDVIT